MTTFYSDVTLAAGSMVVLPEGAAHHARVKRLTVGEEVHVTDGRGRIGAGTIRHIARAEVQVELHALREVPQPPPLELFAPVGDRERMLWMAEKGTELGVTAWRPVLFQRSRSVSPRGEGLAFSGKVRARMVAALEQSGGAWLPLLHAEEPLPVAARAATLAPRYLLDAGGPRLNPDAASHGAAVMLGPEGGVEPGERELLLREGWQTAALAANVLRFETAGIAAVAIIRAAQVPAAEPCHE